MAITKAYSTTSNPALQVLAGIPPIDLLLEREACLQRVLSSNGRTETYHGLLVEWGGHESPLPAFARHPTKLWAIDWKPSVIPASAGRCIYTDGSKYEGQVGAAFCVFIDGTLYHSEGFRLPDHASVFQAEMIAILRALEWLKLFG